jgi:transcriptional regulator of acetoin/glycerol metabolism
MTQVSRPGVAEAARLDAAQERPRPLIDASWRRSVDYGLARSDHPDYAPLSPKLLGENQERNRLLMWHGAPVMESLYDQIADTESMILLTDSAGLILHALGDDGFLERANKVALCPGVSWAEFHRGTNAIGTAIAGLAPTVVHGEEHFLAANRILTCSAVPISDPQGGLMGVLDITGDRHSYQHHTIALARLSGMTIEKRVFLASFPDALILELHSRPEFLGTLRAGLVAVAQDGGILAANPSALVQLGCSLDEVRSQNAQGLFGITISGLIDHAWHGGDRPLPLLNHAGLRLFARVRVRLVRMHGQSTPGANAKQESVAAPVDRKSVADSTLPAASALDILNTGDPAISDVLRRLRKVIGRDIPILIHGETGTGKELLARAIHADSPRRDQPYIAINCASIPEGLMESELFGYEEGAFTGASRKGAQGKIRQADGGTLFLDEIGDMPASLQARMLRVLQERVVTPLGSPRSYPVNIAIICATHRRLKDTIAEGGFREDLYYRLNGLQVSLPPLRDREDLDVLVARILSQESGQACLRLEPEVLGLFRVHPWPGNIRQLTNLLRTAAAMVESDSIGVEHLPEDFLDDLRQAAEDDCAEPEESPHDAKLDEVELAAIQAMLVKTGGNLSEAARRLGISRNTLYRRLKSGC